MLHKVIAVNEPMNKPDWIDKMGRFNELPEPCISSTEKEFQHCFCCYIPEFIEFRQIQLEGHFRDVHILYFWNIAFAVVHAMECTRGNLETQYFKIGCHHQWRPMSEQEIRVLDIHLGRMDHADICKFCGTIHQYNSSD